VHINCLRILVDLWDFASLDCKETFEVL
jgi:hypothetical protein